MKKILGLSLVILLGSLVAFSDIAPLPGEKKPKAKGLDARLNITMMSNVDVATLTVPKAQIKALRAQLEELDTNNDATAATASTTSNGLQTIVSASFLSLAILFGGVWFMRSAKGTSKGSKAAMITLLTLGAASAASLVYANVGPPPSARKITSKLFNKDAFAGNFAFGSIKVVASSETTNVYELVVPDPPDPPKSEE